MHSAAPPAVKQQASPPAGGLSPPEYPSIPEFNRLIAGRGYVFDSLIGQGGMGAVYKGHQINLGRSVAIKVLHRNFGTDYDYAERFRREAQSMALMNHPNIVGVHDSGALGPEFLYFVMEFVEGTDIHQIMAEGKMNPDLAVRVMLPLCDALEYAHSKGIVHRDIKPANVMLSHDGRVKVMDFGLAKRIDAGASFVTRSQLALGTPDYAAPEQYDAVPDIDHRADIYSLGVVLYQMLTGTVPRGVWQLPSAKAGTDPRLDGIVVRALMPDRNQRYQTVAELRQALYVVLTQPLAAAVTPPPPEPPPLAGRTRVLLLEDDLLLCKLITRNLQTAGMEVVQTADGNDTVRHYRESMSNGSKFDLVLIDLTIPAGMGGAETMKLLRQLDPQVTAIVSSGNNGDHAMLEPLAYGFAAALAKPYESPDLVRLIREVLAARRSGK